MGTAAEAEEGRREGISPRESALRKFIATLTNATLKGRWCGIKDGQLGPDKDDSYTIVSVQKLNGDNWQINARLSYGGKTIDLPIPAQVKWAGDTPVLILDKVSMGTPRGSAAPQAGRSPSKSGRTRRVFSRARSRRHAAIAAWWPLRRISGTRQPRKSTGRV